MHLDIRPLRPADVDELAVLRERLWPEASQEDHREDLERLAEGRRITLLPYAVLVARTGETLAGFVETGLRSYADGCDALKPVGYLEGWYVAESYRQQGIGRALLRAAEEWARSQGCSEMASDTSLDNSVSQRAHEALGFTEVERSVLYRKTL